MVHVLQKTQNLVISRWSFPEDGKKCTKNYNAGAQLATFLLPFLSFVNSQLLILSPTLGDIDMRLWQHDSRCNGGTRQVWKLNDQTTAKLCWYFEISWTHNISFSQRNMKHEKNVRTLQNLTASSSLYALTTKNNTHDQILTIKNELEKILLPINYNNYNLAEK